MIRIRGSTRAFGLGTVNVTISRTQMGSQLRGNRVKKSKSGKLSDLTGDGKVTQADVLKGRGVFKKGGKVGYHRMPDGTMMQDSEHNMKEGGNVRKYFFKDGMNSESLKKRVFEDSLYRDREIGETYRDRGSSGKRQMDEELDREMGEYVKDYDLIESYGRDAPKARSFNTRRAAGGAVKKMQAGGKVRGYGKARGGKPCKMM